MPKALTLAVAKAIISHSEDTSHSITQFIGLFAGKTELSDIYTGGKYKSALNASRVFGGYLSGKLKIEPTAWADLTQTFYKMPEQSAAVIAMGGDVLVGLNTLKGQVDSASAEALERRRANGKAHATSVTTITKGREAYIKAGLPADEAIKLLEAEYASIGSLLQEVRANAEKALVA
jgi:hypothetical protein